MVAIFQKFFSFFRKPAPEPCPFVGWQGLGPRKCRSCQGEFCWRCPRVEIGKCAVKISKSYLEDLCLNCCKKPENCYTPEQAAELLGMEPEKIKEILRDTPTLLQAFQNNGEWLIPANGPRTFMEGAAIFGKIEANYGEGLIKILLDEVGTEQDKKLVEQMMKTTEKKEK